MTHTTPLLVFFGVLATATIAILLTGNITFGNVTATNFQDDKSEKYTFFATSTNQTVFGTTSTALSTSLSRWTDSNGRIDNGYMVVDGAKRVTFWFDREWGSGNAGLSTFDVDVSYDGVTWQDYAYLKSATTSATYATVPLAGTSTSVVSLDLVSNTFYAVRCNVTETTDGTHYCKALADY
jgi:hypothetical protein